MALSDNLIAAWEFDEASGSAIDSHGANDLTETSGTIATGTGLVYSTARDFDADDTEYFELADNVDLSTGDIDFTFEAWINMESKAGAGSYNAILTKWASSNLEYFLGYEGSVDRFRFFVEGAAGAVTANNLGSPSTSTWYQLICWHDAINNQVGIVGNAGTANTAAYGSGITNSTAAFRIGNDTENGARYFDGLIGPVRFWKRVLTSDERTELYNSGAGRTYAYITGGGGGSGFRSRIAGGLCVAA